MVQDLRFAVRMLARGRSVSAAVIVLLALGIGANIAIFSVIDTILLRPLPGVEEPERLVQFLRIEGGQTSGNLAYADYLDFRDQSRCFNGVAAESTTALSFAGGKTERLRGAVVSGNYFSVLGVKPAIGRLLTPADDRNTGGAWVAVIGYGLWTRSYAGDPGIVGKIIRLNGHDFTIAGVAAADFHGMALGTTTEVWLPMALQPVAIPRLPPEIMHDRTAGWIAIYARLKPGVALEQARSELGAIADRLARLYPATNQGHGADLAGGIGLYPDERKNLKTFFSLLFAAVGLLLMISCCNAANLLLGRAITRKREIAVRMAIGAARSRIVRQLLVESLLAGLSAAAVGLLLARWGKDLLIHWFSGLQKTFQAGPPLSLTVAAFTVGVSLLAVILFGVAPALAGSRVDIAEAFKEAAPASGIQRSRMVQGLVIAQVTISFVLLIGAGLVTKSLRRIVTTNQGFDARGVLVASLDLSTLDYPEPRTRSFFKQLLERLSELPGVRSASLSKTYPALGWADGRSIFYEGQEPSQEELRRQSNIGIRTQSNTVSPGFFRTLGIPLMAGCDFGPQDTAGSTLVCIVSQILAERLWPGASPLGKRIMVPSYRGPHRPPVEIIGVAADVKYRSLVADAPLFLYLPLLQNHEVFVSLQVRVDSDSADIAPMIAQKVAELDRDLPLYRVQTLADQVRGILWQQRAAAGWITLFGSFALLIASVGLYSVIANAVAQRTPEIGIRVALGARSQDVLSLVLRSGMGLAAAGVALGTGAALMMGRLLPAYFYGVSPADPATFLAVAVVLLAVSLAACYVPARGALRIDSVHALRHE